MPRLLSHRLLGPARSTGADRLLALARPSGRRVAGRLLAVDRGRRILAVAVALDVPVLDVAVVLVLGDRAGSGAHRSGGRRLGHRASAPPACDQSTGHRVSGERGDHDAETGMERDVLKDPGAL